MMMLLMVFILDFNGMWIFFFFEKTAISNEFTFQGSTEGLLGVVLSVESGRLVGREKIDLESFALQMYDSAEERRTIRKNLRMSS